MSMDIFHVWVFEWEIALDFQKRGSVNIKCYHDMILNYHVPWGINSIYFFFHGWIIYNIIVFGMEIPLNASSHATAHAN